MRTVVCDSSLISIHNGRIVLAVPLYFINCANQVHIRCSLVQLLSTATVHDLFSLPYVLIRLFIREYPLLL